MKFLNLQEAFLIYRAKRKHPKNTFFLECNKFIYSKNHSMYMYSVCKYTHIYTSLVYMEIKIHTIYESEHHNVYFVNNFHEITLFSYRNKVVMIIFSIKFQEERRRNVALIICFISYPDFYSILPCCRHRRQAFSIAALLLFAKKLFERTNVNDFYMNFL